MDTHWELFLLKFFHKSQLNPVLFHLILLMLATDFRRKFLIIAKADAIRNVVPKFTVDVAVVIATVFVFGVSVDIVIIVVVGPVE